MRGKPIKHRKHEKLAIAAFIITLAISIIAFYYVWQQNKMFGRTIEGLRNYYCASEDLTPEECAGIEFVQAEKGACCCWNPSSTSKFKGKMEVVAEIGADPEASCARECEEHGRELKNTGYCRWVEEA